MKKALVFLFFVLLLTALFSCGTNGRADETEKAPENEGSENVTETDTDTEKITFVHETEATPETEAAIDSNAEETEDVTECVAEETEEYGDGSPEDILSHMTTEEKIGQLFLCRAPSDAEDGKALIEKFHIGGFIFFGSNFKKTTPEKFKELTSEYQNLSKLGLLCAVDEEGGTVCRASLYPSFRAEKFRSPAEIYADGGLDAILDDSAEKTAFLLSLGLNFNLAPVADVSVDEADFIHARSLGLDADTTSEYVAALTEKMRADGILSALKHFPGYGNNVDTHTGIAYDERSLETLRSCDLLPFEAGIAAGAPVVMISHNIVKSIDPDLPASLSPKVNSLLRDELGFCGVTVTDDLSMDAITKFTDGESAAVLAVSAGNDLLCTSDVETQYPALLAAVKNGTIDEKTLDCAVRRILKMKSEYGIFK